MRIVGKILLGLLIVLLVLALVLATFFMWTVRRSFPQTEGSITIQGLKGEVEIIRNERGIPDVYADNPQDLFIGLGYAAAQDRFWQMDVNRHITAGRLSEMFGKSTINEDAFLRTMGWRDIAEQEYQMISPAAKQMLTSYAQGVNQYLEGKTAAEVSFEYVVLGLNNPSYEIEKWDPIDSVAWAKAMAYDLWGNLDQEMSRVLTAAKVGIPRSEQLFPPYPYERNGTIISDAQNRNLAADQEGAMAAEAAAMVQSKAAVGAFERAYESHSSLAAIMRSQGEGIGSDSWVVSGDLTGTGQPLLADDMHLGPQMPSIWYQAGIHCRTVSAECPYNVAGFMFASIPGIIVGHNDHIAWGFTNVSPDVTDLVLEQVKGESYFVDGKRQPILARKEVLQVANAEPVRITVRSTQSGPIISDIYGEASEPYVRIGKEAPVPSPGDTVRPLPAKRGDGYAVALKWTALTPRPMMDALPLLNTASDFEEFRKAAAKFYVPSQNMVFADTKGNIGYQTPGAIPVRKGYNGHWPVPGWDSRFEWASYIPFDDLPSIENPPAGWITTANQYVVPGDSPQAGVQSDVYAYGARAKRINIRLAEIVNAGAKITTQDMQNIQMDAGNDLAAWLVPNLQQFQPGGTAGEALQMLQGWDFQQPADSAQAMYFNAFYRALLDRMFTDELGEEKAVAFNAGDRFWEVIRVLWEKPNDPWWDDVRTAEKETRDDTVNAALVAAADELTKNQGSSPDSWNWGDAHTLTVQNQTLGKSGIGPIESIFNRGPIETSGGGSIPLATNWLPVEGYEVTAVPSMRQVVDMSDLDASTWVNLTGNSGHTYNPNYVDQLDAWNNGTQFPWAFSRPKVQEAGSATLTLTP